MLKLALVEIFRLFDLLISFAAVSPPAVSEDWRIAWVFPLFLGRHSGTVASSNILLSNKQLVLERDFDLNPLWRRPLDRYWHFRPSPILVCAWCHFQYKSEVTFFDKSHHWNLKINPIKTTKHHFSKDSRFIVIWVESSEVARTHLWEDLWAEKETGPHQASYK